MENTKSISPEIIVGMPEGTFSIDKRTAASQFEFPLQLPPLASGLQPSLALQYSSQPDRFHLNAMSDGWSLKGLDILLRAPNGDYLKNGQTAIEVSLRNGSLMHFTKEGLCERYEGGHGLDPDVYQLTEVKDAYGNKIKYEYHQDGRPDTISYGYSGTLNRRIEFMYRDDSNRLCTLKMYLENTVAFEYRLQYLHAELHRILPLAINEEGSFSRKAVSFIYGSENSNLLETIVHQNSSETQIYYEANSRVVSQYVEVYPEFGGKRSRNAYQVLVGEELPSDKGKNGFDRVEVWSSAAGFGSFWTYNRDGQFKALKSTEGIGHERDYQGLIVPTLLTTFNYATLKTVMEPVLVQKDTEEWISANNALPKKTEVFEYDDSGNLLRMCDGNVLRVKAYEVSTEPFSTPIETSNILYDISQSATLDAENILQADYFKNIFDQKSGQLQKTEHVQQMAQGRYANPVITIFNNFGQVERVLNVDGSERLFSYDDYGFPAVEILTSSEGAQSIHLKTVYCPRTGALLWQKDMNGAVVQTEIDAFGSEISRSEKDLMCPKSWASDRDLILTSQQELTWDDRYQVFISTVLKAVGNDHGLLREVQVLDASMRPIIQGLEIEPRVWQLQLSTYEVQKGVSRQSLPLTAKGEIAHILGKIKRLNKRKVKWISRYQDYRGRDLKTVYPDGSKRIFKHHTNENGDLFETVTSCLKEGQISDRQQRLVTSDRSLHEINPGDKSKTVSHFDVLGRLIKKEFANGSTSTFEWDQVGNCISEKNSMTGVNRQIVGPDLRLNQISQNGMTTNFEYDWRGRLIEQVEETENNEVRRYQVSFQAVAGIGVSTCVMPSGHVLRQSYAPTGELIRKEIIEPDGFKLHVETDYWRDGSARQRHFSDGRTLEYVHDGRGFLVSAGLKEESKPLYTAQNHNFSGIPAKTIYANGITEYRKCNRFGQLADFKVYCQNARIKACYLAQELQHTKGYPGLVNEVHQAADRTDSCFTSYAFDPFQRLNSARQYLENDPQTGFDLLKTKQEYVKKLDANADVLSLQSATVSASFGYGRVGQLQSGERQDTSGTVECQFEYTLEGDLFLRSTQDGSVTLKVDQDYEVTRYGGGETIATLKIFSEQGAIAELTKSLNEVQSNLAQEACDDATAFTFVPKSDGCIFIHLDFQGSSVLATDEEGALLCRAAFLPFGQIDDKASEGRVGFDLVYAGMVYDPKLQLYNAGARFYSAEFGLFLSADPLKSSEDFHAYPTDPINYFDFQGLCRCPNLARSFQENYGRSTNLRGGVLATAVSCFAVFMPVYLYMFGYDLPASLRWTIGLGTWFITASIFGSLFAHLNRSWNGTPADPTSYVCGPYGSIFVKTLIATTIAVVYLGPMLSFIGNDECAPYALLNCSNEFYTMNVVRGTLATSLATPIGGLFARFMQGRSSRSLSLSRMYGYHLGALWFSYGAWQVFDVLQLRILYGRDPISVLHFKRAFLTGEIFLGMLMAQPNPIWSLLPVFLPASLGDGLFSARRQTVEGEVVPWFIARDLADDAVEEPSAQGIQIEVLPDLEAPDNSDTEEP